MAIEVLCVCGQFLKAKDEFAGKRIKCPHCGAGLQVPGTPAPAPAPGPAAREAIALGDGPIPFELPTARVSEPSAPMPTAPATAATAAVTAPVATAPQAGARQGLEYKVIMHKDMGFTTRFDPAKLEDALNRFSAEGWGVRSAVVLNLPGHAGAHDELVVILER